MVSWYASAAGLPPLVGRVPFLLGKSGLPEPYCSAFAAQPCVCIHVTAADYHWVHAPCAGTLRHVDLTNSGMGPYSKSKNASNPTNYRALIVLEPRPKVEPRSLSSGGFGCCALVLVGSLSQDSVLLEPDIEAGEKCAQGQRLGCFAGGGSAAVLCFFDRPVALVEACAAVRDVGMTFHLDCGASLAQPGGGGGGSGGSGGGGGRSGGGSGGGGGRGGGGDGSGGGGGGVRRRRQ